MPGGRNRPLSIAIVALGGQGGGVLTKWLVDIAEACGFLAQSTFVAGVAQRTGATVYCVEMFPTEDLPADVPAPVFTPYPVPGDVDVVVAGEITEAGRAIQKGFVTPNATTLIASTHRVYSIEEKVALGDGIVDQQPVHEAAKAASRHAVLFDMQQAADDAGAVISAVLLGAIASSGAFPFKRQSYEAAIRKDGRAVEANLRGFAAGFDGDRSKSEEANDDVPIAEGPNGERLLSRVRDELPQVLESVAAFGALRALDFQDAAYGDDYLDRVRAFADIDGPEQSYRLTLVVARLLALQMCYEDTIRVAELKTRAARFHRVRQHLNADESQIAYLTEYFHPRFEEFCDTLPARVGRFLHGSRVAQGLLQPLFRGGRLISTNKLSGYLMLRLLARTRRWRRGTLRFENQHAMIDAWLETVRNLIQSDYDAAVAVASSIEIVRGYGDTWQRGFSRYQTIVEHFDALPVEDRARKVRQLLTAALADESGSAFTDAMANLEAA